MTTGVFIQVSDHRGEHLQNFFLILITLVTKKDFVKLMPTEEMEIELMKASWKCLQTGTVSCSVLRQNSNWFITLKILLVFSIWPVSLKNTDTVCLLVFSYLFLHLIDFKWKRKCQGIVSALLWITGNKPLYPVKNTEPWNQRTQLYCYFTY